MMRTWNPNIMRKASMIDCDRVCGFQYMWMCYLIGVEQNGCKRIVMMKPDGCITFDDRHKVGLF